MVGDGPLEHPDHIASYIYNTSHRSDTIPLLSRQPDTYGENALFEECYFNNPQHMVKAF